MSLCSIHSQISHSTLIRQRNVYVKNFKPSLIQDTIPQHVLHYKSNSIYASKERKTDFSLQMGLIDFFTSNKTSVSDTSAEDLKNELLNIIKGKYTGPLSSEKQQRFDEIVSELNRISPKNPTRSPLFYGKFKILFTTKPATPKDLIFDIFPDKTVNMSFQVSKFGFKVAKIDKPGTYRITKPNQYQVSGDITKDGKKVEVDGVSTFKSNVDILYLDETLKIEKALRSVGTSEPELSFLISRRELSEEKSKEEPELPLVSTRKQQIVSKFDEKSENKQKIKELIDELNERVKIAQQTSKEITSNIKNIERDNLDILKEANAFNKKIKNSEIACENLESEIKQLLENEKLSQEELKQSKLKLQGLQNQLLKL